MQRKTPPLLYGIESPWKISSCTEVRVRVRVGVRVRVRVGVRVGVKVIIITVIIIMMTTSTVGFS